MNDFVRIETDQHIIEQSVHHRWTRLIRKKYPPKEYLFIHGFEKVFTAPRTICDVPYIAESKYWDYYSVIK